MTQQEVESLVFRLVGDGTSYMKMMKDAITSTEATTKAVEDAQKRIQATQAALQGVGSAFMGALAATGAVAWLTSAGKAAEDAELRMVRLRSAIASNGADVESTMESYEAFANAISKVTRYSAAETYAMLRKAEAYGLTGDAARAAVKNAISIAAVRGGSPEAFLRVTAREDPRGLKMALPSLRGVKNEQELVAKASKLMAEGFQQARLEGETVSAKQERLLRTLTALKIEVGKVVQEAMQPFLEVLKDVATWFTNLDPEIRKVIVQVGAFTAALLLIRPVLFFLSPIVGVFQAVGAALLSLVTTVFITVPAMLALKAVVLLQVVAWVAWKVAMVVATGAILLFNAVFVVMKFLLVGAGAAALGHAAAVTLVAAVSAIATAAIWLFTSAVTTLTAAFVAGMVVVLAVVAAFGLIAAVVLSVVAAIGTLVTVFSDMPSAEGPLGAMSSMFQGWYGIILDVVRAAKFDLPLAWDIAKNGLALAVSQMKDLWPPLWAVIQAGFDALWAAVAKSFSATLEAEYQKVHLRLANILTFGSRSDRIEKAKQIADDGAQIARDSAAAEAKARIEAALRGFKVTESAATTSAKETAAKLKEYLDFEDALNEFQKDWDADVARKAEEEALNTGKGFGKTMKQGFKSEKFDAALFDSAEAITRIQDFQDKLKEQREGRATDKGGATGKFDAVAANSAEAASRQEKANQLLAKIGQGIDKLVDKEGESVAPAEFAA